MMPCGIISRRRQLLARKNDKRKGFLLLILLLASPAFASSLNERLIRQGTVEFFIGSYNMNEPRFDKVYPGGGTIGGLALSSALVNNFNFYLEMKYYPRTGKLTFTLDETRFTLIPLSLGVRFILPLGYLNPYIGGGADFYFYTEDNPIGTVVNYTNGVHFIGGAYVQFSRKIPVMLNVKLKYTTARATENDIQIQLGGLEYGIGLVFAF